MVVINGQEIPGPLDDMCDGERELFLEMAEKDPNWSDDELEDLKNM